MISLLIFLIVLSLVAYVVIGVFISWFIDVRLFDDDLSWHEAKAMMYLWPMSLGLFVKALTQPGGKSSYYQTVKSIKQKVGAR